MDLYDLTLDTPQENLALDLALLEEAEAAPEPREALRLWESPRACVVVGRNSDVEREVRLEACRAADIPVLRRASGGCAVVVGPGCLMYSLVLSYRARPELARVDAAHRFVLGRMAEAVSPLVPVTVRGTSDLAIDERKFSGNSLRCRRRALLYHGTMLYAFPLELIGTCLRMPPREPDYRGGRPHEQFVANLPVAVDQLRGAVISAWQASPATTAWPRQRVAALARDLADGRAT
jgi:lipoate-protein ligase A